MGEMDGDRAIKRQKRASAPLTLSKMLPVFEAFPCVSCFETAVQAEGTTLYFQRRSQKAE